MVELFWVNSILVLRNGCKEKENVGFFKGIAVKNFVKPLFCFGYRLSYNHPNQLIPIVKEP